MKKLNLIACAVSLSLLGSACTPTNHIRGNIVEDFRLAEVKPGIDTRSDVLRKLGSPTTKAPFDENVWYYIGQETQKRGILDEDIQKERIVMATFDQEGTLASIEELDNNRLDLPYEREKTPTTGNEVTAVQQFFGNVGRFNKQR
ncbi:MAG: outer membrane protein assembly factor BamE [Rhodospirillales bacterium]|nr:outer membrane protein assembly factor BamE [Rhodospirillales bacterium]